MYIFVEIYVEIFPEIFINLALKQINNIFEQTVELLKTQKYLIISPNKQFALKVQSHGAYDRLRPVCDLYTTSRAR